MLFLFFPLVSEIHFSFSEALQTKYAGKKKVYAAKWQKKIDFNAIWQSRRTISMTCQGFCDLLSLVEKKCRKGFDYCLFFLRPPPSFLRLSYVKRLLVFYTSSSWTKKYLLRDFYYFEMSYDTRSFCTHLGVEKKILLGASLENIWGCKCSLYLSLQKSKIDLLFQNGRWFFFLSWFYFLLGLKYNLESRNSIIFLVNSIYCQDLNWWTVK